MAFIESGKSFDKESNYKKMQKRMKNMDTVQYPLRIEKSLYKKLKIKAAKEETSIRAIIMNLIEKYADK